MFRNIFSENLKMKYDFTGNQGLNKPHWKSVNCNNDND